MIIELPLTVLIIVIGAVVNKWMDVEYNKIDSQRIESNKLEQVYECLNISDSKINELRKELDEYKKRVDTLGLKAGFKL